MKRQTNESCGILAPYLLPTVIIKLAPAKQILEETALLIFLVSGAGQGAGGGGQGACFVPCNAAISWSRLQSCGEHIIKYELSTE